MADPWFVFKGKETGTTWGDLPESPELTDHEMALKLNEAFDRIQRSKTRQDYGNEPITVEYLAQEAD
jgi:hypothetical protein